LAVRANCWSWARASASERTVAAACGPHAAAASSGAMPQRAIRIHGRVEAAAHAAAAAVAGRLRGGHG